MFLKSERSSKFSLSYFLHKYFQYTFEERMFLKSERSSKFSLSYFLHKYFQYTFEERMFLKSERTPKFSLSYFLYGFVIILHQPSPSLYNLYAPSCHVCLPAAPSSSEKRLD